jgi:hypothetical protein
MRRVLAGAAIGLVVACGSSSHTATAGSELVSAVAYQSLDPCDGATRYPVWANPTTGPIRIRKVSLFEGFYLDAQSDVAMDVRRASDDMLIATYPRDAYEGSTRECAPHIVDFGGDYMTIQPGDGLRIAHFCTNISASPDALFTVNVWYATE